MRLSEEVAEKLRRRILSVTQRSCARISASYVKEATNHLIVSARDAGTNAVQTRYFEALDGLEKNQQSIAENFTSGVTTGIEEISDVDEILNRRRKRDSGSSPKLELVDTAQFEEWLLVAEII